MDKTLLMSLLAAQCGARSPGTQDFLARAAAAGASAFDPQELMSRLGQDNPTVAAMMQMMAGQKTPAQTQEPVAEAAADGLTADEIEELRSWLEASNNEASALREQLQTALGELKILRERSDLLALALGACCLCWGQDPACRACRGNGHPGKSVPDEDLFSEYVLPAVQLMRASRQRSSVVTVLPNGANRAPGADSTPMRHTS